MSNAAKDTSFEAEAEPQKKVLDFDFTQPPPRPDTIDQCFDLIETLWVMIGEHQANAVKVAQDLEHANEKLKTNSRNSSKPPSQDPNATKKRNTRRYSNRKKSNRKQGAQPGHTGRGRKLLPIEEVDDVIVCLPPTTCGCGGNIEPKLDKYQRFQVYELPVIKPIVTEYQKLYGRCNCCKTDHLADLPPGVPNCILGIRALSNVGVFIGKYSLSKRNVAGIFRDHFNLDVALGTVSNAEKIISKALKKPVQAALEYIQQAMVKNVDETGSKQKGNRMWAWVCVSFLVSVFLIRNSRSQEVCKEILGNIFNGTVIADRCSAYNWIDDNSRQYCWAHLFRDFIKISERSGDSGRIGELILSYSRRIFLLWWRYKEGKLSRKKLIKICKRLQLEVENQLEAGARCGNKKTEATCKRILKHKVSLWIFITTKDVEPTNNKAEQVIRAFVMWRKRSYGTQSERGDRFIERIMTVMTSCRLQNRNELDYLAEAIQAYFENREAPSLIPSD